jgi:hypothetical protein
MYFNPGRKNVLRNGENRSLPRSYCSAASSTRCAPGLDCVANGLSTDSRFNAMSQSDSSAASHFRHFCIQIPEKFHPNFVRDLSATFRDFSAVNLQLNIGNGLKTNDSNSGI